MKPQTASLNAAVSVSFCATGQKGDGHSGTGCFLRPTEHATMLLETVRYLREEVDWPIVVSITAWPGMVRIPVSPEEPTRDVLWELWRLPRVRFVTIPDNPGHQRGACWSIRMAIEAARKLDCDYLVHSADDVVPAPGILPELVRRLAADGTDYCGERWGHQQDELNSQFFACRLSWFATHYSGDAIGDRHNELYLADLMRGRPISAIERVYAHTHNPEEHRRHLAEARARRQA